MAEDGGAVAASAATSTSRNARRLELRASNLAAWNSGGIEINGSLDSSLKRNTAFIKRLRTSLHAVDGPPALLKEVNALSLEKYTSELVSASTEGLSRCKTASEISAAIEVVSMIHQRFPELVSVPMVSTLQASLSPPSKAALAAMSPEQRDKEETNRITRQRAFIRVYAELELVGIVRADRQAAAGDATFAILRDLLTADKELLVSSIPLATAFTKNLGSTFLPSPPSASKEDQPTPAEALEGYNQTSSARLVSSATQDKFRKLLCAYFEALSRRAVRDHTTMLETDKRNHEAYIRSGEIFEDRAQNYERLARSWEKLWSGAQSLAESLALPLPTLPALPSNTIVTGTGASIAGRNDKDGEIGGPGSLWADDEERRFYTDLLDLRGEVPGSLLKSGADTTTDEDRKNAQKPERAEQPDAREQKADADDIGNPTAAVDVDDGLAPQPAAQLTALLGRLPDLSNRDAIDRAAVDFTFLNSKPARKRLVRHVGAVPRSRQDLIPYYSRLVATLNQYMPDVGTGLVSLLEDEYRYFQRKKGQDLAESRSKNIRFLCELTKFGICPTHSILHVLKVSLDDFSGHNLDNLCTLLEGCGRYLLRSDATKDNMSAMLETMKRKRGIANLDARQSTMLDNAYYQCDPPDRPIVVPKERTPMQLYIRHLLYDVLSKPNLETVVRALRKMHWEDPAIVRKLYNAFTKVWKIKFSNIYLFAIALHDLARWHSDFCVSVIDGVLESITAGLERNSFKDAQQRMAQLKYVGELYTYRMLDARVVLDTLWLLVTFGHADGRPVPDSPCRIDGPEDYLRIRLICTLLDTCGIYFDRGILRKKMDAFLAFFQMYCRSKKQPLPMDVDFMLTDTFESLRPKLTLLPTYEEAAKAVDDIVAKANAQAGPAEVLAEAELDDDAGEGARVRSDQAADAPPSSEDEAANGTDMLDDSSSISDSSEDSDSDNSVSSEDEEEAAARAVQDAEDDEFERELARMMADSGGTDNRRAVAPGTKSVLSEALPANLRRQQPPSTREGDGDTEGNGQPVDESNMHFTLLLKKGSKAQSKGVSVPRDSALAMHTLTQQAKDKDEQRELKRLVLDYERREDAQSRKDWVDQAGRRGIRINFQGT